MEQPKDYAPDEAFADTLADCPHCDGTGLYDEDDADSEPMPIAEGIVRGVVWAVVGVLALVGAGSIAGWLLA
jgi:hypothetical protein